MCRCLYCYQELEEGQKDFHPKCARKFFGTREVPVLEYRHEDLDRLAEQVIRAQTSLTGVQPKLSLNLSKHEGCSRLTIVGLWGEYIFKPQTEDYPLLPENEDLTMHLAEAAKISVVPHCLIRLADGRLGYITKRIDRTKTGEKIDMEDMCQLTLHPTEYKYKGSYEQIAKTIVQYSSVPKLDLTNYMQLLLFANPEDKEELALSLCGRKTKLRLEDFLKAAKTMGLEESVVLRLIASLHKALPQWRMLIRHSFLSDEMKNKYEEFITSRLSRI